MNPEHNPIGELGTSEPTPNVEITPSVANTEDRVEQRRAENTAIETQRQRAHAVEAGATRPATPSSLALPAPMNDGSGQVAPRAGTTQTPLVASDDDLMEKEWVQAIKRVLLETRDNPYGREQAIKNVQADYVMKRYGIQIGKTDD